MKGFVPTPAGVVDAMVEKLFRLGPPAKGESVLDPGCGTGAFIDGIVRWCSRHDYPLPRIVGIDSDQRLLDEARTKLKHLPEVELVCGDFLAPRSGSFHYVIGNPPYVPITGLSLAERTDFKRRFLNASGRFDLYLLFFEQALKLLGPAGRLVFITPEKYLYTATAGTLRKQLADRGVEEIELIHESTFGDLVTYPTITTVTAQARGESTRVRLRDGSTRLVRAHGNGSSWVPLINGNGSVASGHRLSQAFIRISCGVATGADRVFLVKTDRLSPELKPFARPTVSGREIVVGEGFRPAHSILLPYDGNGELIPEAMLDALGAYLRQPERKEQLLARTCVRRKPWYAFHENPPLSQILRPKILCKDIASRPYFVPDKSGTIVPRHSVYYLVPKRPEELEELCEFLNSRPAAEWLVAHCQRAANGFIRLQSHMIKQLPIPPRFIEELQESFA